ncbi:MAG TPA: bacteriohemerythrin [Bacillota bacterium]|nr:bacteriohemerythrin [Bacillota bacterium]
MKIEWSRDLEVNNLKIDTQHQELFRRINQLFEACSEGKGSEMVAETIKFLEEYVVVHFETEETLMVEARYPGYAVHKGYHRNFIASFKQLKEQIDPKGPGLNIVILVNRMVVEWLNQHIRNVDKEFAQFLRSQK